MSPAGTRLWHPFSAMGKVDGHEFVLARGEGSRVWDVDGNEYLDATAGLWFANVGHGRLWLVTHFDQFGGVLGGRERLRNHKCDRLADMAHAACREHGP